LIIIFAAAATIFLSMPDAFVIHATRLIIIFYKMLMLALY